MTFDNNGRPHLWAKCWTCKHLLPGWQCKVWLYQRIRSDGDASNCRTYEPRAIDEERKSDS